jgi:hypothetical protein
MSALKAKSHFSITQATVMTVVGAVATGIVTLVPSWGAEAKIIVASLGGVTTAVFPLVNAVHKTADSILAGHQALAGSNVSAHDVEQRAIVVARSEAHAVLATADLGPAVSQAIDAKNLPALEGVGRDELNRVLVSILPGMSDLINKVLPIEAVPVPAQSASGMATATVGEPSVIIGAAPPVVA